MTGRAADTARFYDLLDHLEARVGGGRLLADCSGRMNWPRRGVYFFYENGEVRSGLGGGRRVVRVGTHAVTSASRTTLWNRLSQHRGPARSGGGNHRGSIFRLLVGTALARRGDLPLSPSWSVASDLGAAARRLGVDRAEVKRAEAGLEALVSRTIGAMPFLWLNVGDSPGPGSQRALIERNTIALLSGYREPRAAARSPVPELARTPQRPPARAPLRPLEQPPRGRDLRPVLPRRAGRTDRRDQAAVALDNTD